MILKYGFLVSLIFGLMILVVNCITIRVPLQKIRVFYKIVENLHNKVI
jgi:hypothetical protein